MSFESNLKQIMDQKHINQKELLIKILKECKDDNPYDKANQERSNFNNMIKGKRAFKLEYAIAIEKILEIRFCDLYKDEISQRFYENKGIRYAASIDKIEEYEKLINEIEDVFQKTDEYGKNIFDYICEYNSKTGLDYLFNKLHISYKTNRLTVVVNDEEKNIYDNSALKLVKMICKNNEREYFRKLFPPYYGLGYKYLYGFVYDNDDFYKSILSSDAIIEELLKLNDTTLKELNNNRIDDTKDKYKVYHPILIKLLNFALNNSNKYKNQLVKIISEGIKLNEIIISNLRRKHNYKYSIDEFDIRNEYTVYGYILNADLSKYEQLDDEIKSLIEKLNEGAKKVEIKPSSSDIDFDEHISPKEFYELIYKNTGINNYYSSGHIVFMEISRLVEEVNCKIDKLGDGLLEFLKEQKNLIDISNLNNESKYQSISFAIAFTEMYRDKLNNL